MIKFGILGCGLVSETHAECMMELEDAVLLGVCDRAEENAKKFAEIYDASVFSTYEEMLANPEIDAVCICVPSGLHAEMADKALDAGKHIVLEKPMALNVEDCDRLIKKCGEKKLCLTVISQLRFSPSIQRVKGLIDSGELGRILSADLYMKYWRKAEYYSTSTWRGTFKMDGGGALMNQGIHGIDIMQYLLGDIKVLGSKVKTAYHNIEVEDLAAAVVEYPCGALGVIQGSTCLNPGFSRQIEIVGTDGYVVIVEDALKELVINGEHIELPEEDKVLSNPGGANNPAVPTTLHKKQIQNFINAIKEKERLLVDAHEGKRAVRAVCEIYKESK